MFALGSRAHGVEVCKNFSTTTESEHAVYIDTRQGISATTNHLEGVIRLRGFQYLSDTEDGFSDEVQQVVRAEKVMALEELNGVAGQLCNDSVTVCIDFGSSKSDCSIMGTTDRQALAYSVFNLTITGDTHNLTI
jgi:hypothetical protein